MYTHDTRTPSQPSGWRAGPQRLTAREALVDVLAVAALASPLMAAVVALVAIKGLL